MDDKSLVELLFSEMRSAEMGKKYDKYEAWEWTKTPGGLWATHNTRYGLAYRCCECFKVSESWLGTKKMHFSKCDRLKRGEKNKPLRPPPRNLFGNDGRK